MFSLDRVYYRLMRINVFLHLDGASEHFSSPVGPTKSFSPHWFLGPLVTSPVSFNLCSIHAWSALPVVPVADFG